MANFPWYCWVLGVISLVIGCPLGYTAGRWIVRVCAPDAVYGSSSQVMKVRFFWWVLPFVFAFIGARVIAFLFGSALVACGVEGAKALLS